MVANLVAHSALAIELKSFGKNILNVINYVEKNSFGAGRGSEASPVEPPLLEVNSVQKLHHVDTSGKGLPATLAEARLTLGLL